MKTEAEIKAQLYVRVEELGAILSDYEEALSKGMSGLTNHLKRKKDAQIKCIEQIELILFGNEEGYEKIN